MSTGITPLDPAQTKAEEAGVAKEGYIRRELIGLDIFADETLDGQPDMTISSRLARWAYNYKGVRGFIGRLGSKVLDLFQHDHGAAATAGDVARAKQLIQTEDQTGIISK